MKRKQSVSVMFTTESKKAQLGRFVIYSSSLNKHKRRFHFRSKNGSLS